MSLILIGNATVNGTNFPEASVLKFSSLTCANPFPMRHIQPLLQLLFFFTVSHIYKTKKGESLFTNNSNERSPSAELI